MASTNISTFLPPAPPRPVSLAPRVWAGCALLLASLVLVGLGGCFLIGILGLLRPDQVLGAPNGVPQPVSLTADDRMFLCTLYAFAFASFAGAVTLFILGVRGLWRLLTLDSQASEG
jgi:hypothetical protein